MSQPDGASPWNRSVIFLMVAAFCTSAAALTTVTALGKQVYDLTGTEISLGLLGLTEFAPAAFLLLITGSVADRFDRRRVVCIAALAEGACGIGLAVWTGTGRGGVLPIFALVLAFGTARAFVAPSARSLPADIVPAVRLPWLVARNSIASQAAFIVGPVLGGTLYAVDERLPYVTMAVLLAIAAVSIQFARPTAEAAAGRAARPSSKPSLHEALLGLRVIRGQPILLGVISLDLFAVLFGGAVALLPAIAEERLHTSAVGYGWLRAAGGIGAALVTLALARHPVTRKVGRTLLVAVGAFGAFTLVLGATTSYMVAFGAMMALTGADAVSVFIRQTIVPLVVTADVRGRVLAVENVFIGASNELGAFESGVVGQLLGPAGAVVLGGIATLAVAGAWAVLFPALRRLDTFGQAARHGAEGAAPGSGPTPASG